MSDAREIEQLEREFWRSMAEGRPVDSAALIAPEAAVVGPMGYNRFSPAQYIQMCEDSPFSMTGWEITEAEVFFPQPALAIILYKGRVDYKVGDKQITSSNHYSSVWTKGGDGWRCVLHSECPQGVGG